MQKSIGGKDMLNLRDRLLKIHWFNIKPRKLPYYGAEMDVFLSRILKY
jgi:hypothetical protein